MKRKPYGIGTLILALLASGLLAASVPRNSAAATTSAADKHEVTIHDFAFSPATLTVPAGAKVTWVNRDDEPHTVTSTDKKFSSQALDTDEQFTFSFTAPGTYEYFCSLHPKMTGKIVVQ